MQPSVSMTLSMVNILPSPLKKKAGRMKTVGFKLLVVMIVQRCCTGALSSQTCEDCPIFKDFFTCNPQTCDWMLANRVWAGNTTENGSLLLAYCAPGNCFFNTSGDSLWIPHNMTHMVNEFLCNQTNRMGILCAQCQPGFGHAINSDTFECVSCTSQSSKVNWFYYILSVYLPLLVVFLIIILFNIHLTTGPANAFIIYAQAITTTLSLDFNTNAIPILSPVFGSNINTKAFLNSYQVPYNILNLDLFSNILPPFCLTADLGTLDILALKYLEALFPVMIIVAIILLLKCQSWLKISVKQCFCHYFKWKGISLPHAFAAFVLLSYNRLCQLTVYLLISEPVWNNTISTVESRVYFSGNLLSTDYNYTIRYKLPAYMILIILIVLPIILLHYPLLWLEKLVAKVTWLHKAYPTASIAILLDTFQGCFRNNRRYFAGLYLAFRLLLFFAYYQVIPLQFLLQLVIIILYILFIAFWKPYKKVFLNYVDMSIFANMAFISCLSWYVEDQASDSYVVPICLVFASILVYLPMLYIIAYLIWHFTSRYHERIKEKCSMLYNGILKSEGHSKYQSIDISVASHANSQGSDDFIHVIDYAGEQKNISTERSV